MSVVDYLRTRVYPKVDDIEVIVVAGNGETPRGNTRISNVRLSYEHG